MQQLMHAIVMVHKMQRLALISNSGGLSRGSSRPPSGQNPVEKPAVMTLAGESKGNGEHLRQSEALAEKERDHEDDEGLQC